MDAIVYTQAIQLANALRRAIPDSKAMSEDVHLTTGLAMLDELVQSQYHQDAVKVLAPFIEVLKSFEVRGPIVLLTFESIERQLVNGVMKGSTDWALMESLTMTISRCRFEASDQAGDEVTLLELLGLIDLMTCGDDPMPLTDILMASLFETVLSCILQTRFSEVLKRAAEDLLVKMCRSVFQKFDKLTDTSHCCIHWPGKRHDQDDVRLRKHAVERELGISETDSSTQASPHLLATDPYIPYGRGFCHAIVDFVVTVFETGEKRFFDRFLPVTIRLISAVFEFPGIVGDDRMCHKLGNPVLRELIRSIGNPAIVHAEQLSAALCFIFAQHRRLFHAQFILFMNHMIGILKGKQGQAAVRLAKPPHQNLIMDILVYCKKGERYDPLISYKALQVITNQCSFIAQGCLAAKQQNDHSVGQRLKERQALKNVYTEAAGKFNDSPKLVESFLVEKGLLSGEHDRKDLAKQVRQIRGINKRVLGEWLSKPGHEDILKAFIEDLNFSGKRVDEALRIMLECFRLPGESQQINRIMEVFADVVYEQTESETRHLFADRDAVYVLAYSVILLNTILFNKQAKQFRMTEADYINNNRGTNGGNDFDTDLQKAIYHAISTNEIIMPEEQEGDLAFNYQWTQLMYTATLHIASPRQTVEVHLVAGELYELTHVPFLDVLSKSIDMQFVFNNPVIIKSICSGISDMATSAAATDSSVKMDQVMCMAWNGTGLMRMFNNPTGNLVARHLMKSELAKKLLHVLVDVFKTHGEVIDKWTVLMELVFILHESFIIKSDTFQTDGNSPTSQLVSPKTSRKKSTEGGLLASLASYIYSEPASPLSNVDLDLAQKAADHLHSACQFDLIFKDCRFLSPQAIKRLLSAFLSTGSEWSRQSQVLSIDICVYCALQNKDRLAMIWSVVYEGLSEKVIKTDSAVLKEHAMLGLGKLALRMSERGDGNDALLQFFQLLCHLPTESFMPVAEPIMAILLQIVEADGQRDRDRLLDRASIWPHYFTIMSLVSRHRGCAPYYLGLLVAALPDDSDRLLFPPEFLTEYLELLSAFIASLSSPYPQLSISPLELAKTALQRFMIVESLVRDAFPFIDYVLPIHLAISQHSCHPQRDIRQLCLSTLQRMVMSFHWSSPEQVLAEFEVVLLPLLDELQKDSSVSKLNGTVEDTQMAAASLASKVFLNNVAYLDGDLPNILLGLLTRLLQFLRFKSETLREGIPETVKNVLFVLKTSGFIQDARSEQWAQIWQLVGQVLPDLHSELFSRLKDNHLDKPGIDVASGSDIAHGGAIDQVPSHDALIPSSVSNGMQDGETMDQPSQAIAAIHNV